MKNTSVSTIIWPRVHNGRQVAGHTESPDLKPHYKTGWEEKSTKQQVRIFHFVFHIKMFYVRLGMVWWCMPLVPVLGDRSRQTSERKVSFIYSQDYRETRLKEQTKIMVTDYRCLKLTSYVCFGFLLR